VAQPVLYSQVEVTTANINDLAATLLSRPDLSISVRHVHLRGVTCDNRDDSYGNAHCFDDVRLLSVVPLIAVAPNLRILHIDQLTCRGVTKLKHMEVSLANLSELTISGCLREEDLDVILSTWPRLTKFEYHKDLSRQHGIRYTEVTSNQLVNMLINYSPGLEELSLDFGVPGWDFTRNRQDYDDDDDTNAAISDHITSLRDLPSLKRLSISARTALDYDLEPPDINSEHNSLLREILANNYRLRGRASGDFLIGLLPKSIVWLQFISEVDLRSHFGAEEELTKLKKAVADGKYPQLREIQSLCVWSEGLSGGQTPYLEKMLSLVDEGRQDSATKMTWIVTPAAARITEEWEQLGVHFGVATKKL
jgi:hypothetical protein